MADLQFKMLDDATPNEHPQVVMRSLNISYGQAIPQSVGDQWWFFDCTLPEGLELPSYLEVMHLPEFIRTNWARVMETE